jgi:hypothetical protein
MKSLQDKLQEAQEFLVKVREQQIELARIEQQVIGRITTYEELIEDPEEEPEDAVVEESSGSTD